MAAGANHGVTEMEAQIEENHRVQYLKSVSHHEPQVMPHEVSLQQLMNSSSHL